MQSLPPALQPLAAYRQFIAYQLVPDASRPGKTFKYPIDIATGRKHDLTDRSAWRTHDQVSAWIGERTDHGCGFVFTEEDPFFFLDIDGQFQAGQWSELATGLVGRLPGVAVEVSQSHTGLHLIGQYRGARPLHGCKPAKHLGLPLELYTADRFVALTGLSTVGSAEQDATEALQAVIAEYFPPSLGAELQDGWWSEEPVPEWTGYADDEEMLRVAMLSTSAAAAFGGKAAFADLWHADEVKLSATYPGDNGRAWDGNSADMALAQHLAFHTGKNAQRMLEMMPRSALVRDKWDRPDYLPRTIRKACAQQVDVFKRREVQPPVATYERERAAAARADSEASYTIPKPERVTGSTYLSPDDQMALFAGCCYASEPHKILTPDGYLYSSEQFNALFGGYTYIMDVEGARKVRNAFECFTQSQAVKFPKTRGVCFKPDKPPGAVVHTGGRSRVNTYVPIVVPRQAGDVQPFLDHMAKMLPNEQDRMTLLAYMAACVQHQGIKFQWAPLIQGVEGNGKTLLALCVAEAIGARYVHWPLAKDIDNTFNSWLWGNIFYAVDEIFIEETSAHVLETLKPMITANRGGIQITQKGVDQTTQDICGNFFFLTNHRNAIKLRLNDRRVAPFFTAQQKRADLARDGMDYAYFQALIGWFEDGGYAKVSEFLHTWTIPHELNPVYHSRKPHTSTTGEALEAGQGRVEQEVLEAIDAGTPGFQGGWISSTALASLLERMRVNLPKARYREMMQELGYELHPHLTDGRVNQLVTPDNNKPRLYVRAGSGLEHITDPKLVAEAYQGAQLGMG
jgi:hypothetical protein